MMRLMLPLAVFAALPALSGCGLQPLYASGNQLSMETSLAQVHVPAIPGQAGWLMRNALTDRLGSGGDGLTRYTLNVRLDDQLEGLGLLGDDTISRERRTVRARYSLVDLSTGEVLLDATAGSDAGIDVVSSEYATIAAEQTALENLTQQIADQIVTRVALSLNKKTSAAQSQSLPVEP